MISKPDHPQMCPAASGVKVANFHRQERALCEPERGAALMG